VTAVELRYLMPGSTPAEVHTATVELAAALHSLAADVPCVHRPSVVGHPGQRALVVQVQVCADDPGTRILEVARMAVLAAAQDARIVLKPVPGGHRLVDAEPDTEAA